jgi:hypothetical protein
MPAMFDSGSSLSLLRSDVLDNIQRLGLPVTLESTEQRCLLANGEPCAVSEIAGLSIKIHSFSWKVRFLVLRDCPLPCILGVDFLTKAKVHIDFAAQKYCFLFRPEREFTWEQFKQARILSREFPSPQKLRRSSCAKHCWRIRLIQPKLGN